MNTKANNRVLSEARMQRLSDWLTARIGLHFAKRSWRELCQKMTAAMRDFGFEQVEEFIEWLPSTNPTRNHIEILASHLTVGETYFFREREAFEILERHLLPDLIKTHRKTEKRLRIWSAGCSTGEEAYSLAILLDRLIKDWQDWNVSILATDINIGFLRKAGEAIYSDWSFRDNPPWFKEHYFEPVDADHWKLLPRIRKMVVFSYLNLCDDFFPALQNNTNAMDFIFCRNVLMYFAPSQIALTVDRFHHCLLDGGHLIVSPVETALLNRSLFVPARFSDLTLFRKDFFKARPGTRGLEDIRETHATPAWAKIEKRIHKVKPKRIRESGTEKKPAEMQKTPLDEATFHYRIGNYAEAEDKLRESFSNGGRNHDSVVLLAKVLANQGKLEEARRLSEEAVLADKLNPALHYLLAIILDEQKQLEEAMASLKKALYLDGNFIMAHFSLANILLQSGKVAEPRKHFANAIEILSGYKPDEIVPESEGITALRLSQIIRNIERKEQL